MNENKNLAPHEFLDELEAVAGVGYSKDGSCERCVCGFAGYGYDA